MERISGQGIKETAERNDYQNFRRCSEIILKFFSAENYQTCRNITEF